MSESAIEALSEEEISAALSERGVDVSKLTSKEKLVSKALAM